MATNGQRNDMYALGALNLTSEYQRLNTKALLNHIWEYP